jgi:hypothetical protein
MELVAVEDDWGGEWEGGRGGNGRRRQPFRNAERGFSEAEDNCARIQRSQIVRMRARKTIFINRSGAPPGIITRPNPSADNALLTAFAPPYLFLLYDNEFIIIG